MIELEKRMIRSVTTIILAGILLAGCEPTATRPGLWVSGEVESFPSDWAFSDEFKTIAMQINAPYLLPHSIVIWCVQVDGTLYVAARAPEGKRWPGWVEIDSDVILKVGERLFDGKLQRLTDPNEIEPVSDAYALKYELTSDLSSTDGPGSWFWRVVSR